VRTLVALVAGLVAIPLAAARPGAPPALSLSVSSDKVLYGQSVTLSGRLAGAADAGRVVVIDAWAYGESTPQRLAAVTTDAHGFWTFKARPTIETIYQANAATTMSRRLTIGVAPKISVAKLANGHLRVRVSAGRSFDRRFVQLQSQNADGTWTTVDRKRLSAASIAVLKPPASAATVRVAMSVNQAGAGYLGSAGGALPYRAEPLMLTPSTLTVQYGHRVTFAGRLASGHAGQRVWITARPYGRPSFTYATVTTGRDGRFTVTANPTILTAYQAHGAGHASPRTVVDVRPIIAVHELGSGRVQVHVISAAFLRGRTVQLQQLTDGHWRTVARQRLTSTATAMFAHVVPPSTVIRIAMSVNQAGAGYLGSASHPILYRGI
jgi:hypothetical protein